MRLKKGNNIFNAFFHIKLSPFKKNIPDVFALLSLSITVILFFLPLFHPATGLFITPDGAASDILHFNYPLKELLSRSLKNNTLPFWTDLIGLGFPALAEAEIGAFLLSNLILFKLFSTTIAFNLGYVVTFFLFAWGMYLVARDFRMSPVVAFFCAYVFTFSGFHIVQIPHYNHLQTFSYFPFIFLCIRKIIQNKDSFAWFVLPFLFSQQIFAGHFQYVFMTSTFLLLYIYLYAKIHKVEMLSFFPKKKLIYTVLLIIGLSSIQLIPTLEYFLYSNRNDIERTFYNPVSGFQIKQLIQLFQPFYFGDIRKGMSQLFLSGNSAYWETFLYIGVIPALLAVFSVFFYKKNNIVKIFWICSVILFIFILDENSPFYFIFSIAPFGWFRIHSRFIAFLAFILTLLSGFVFQEILNSKKINTVSKVIITLSILLLTTIELWRFGAQYNPVQKASRVFDTPQLLKELPLENKRVYTDGFDIEWFDTLLETGFTNIEKYNAYLNGLQANFSLIYNIPSVQIYSGFALNDHIALYNLISQGIKHDKQKKTAIVSTSAINVLRLLSVDFIISMYIFNNTDLQLLRKINLTALDTSIYVYQVMDKIDPYYFTSNIYDNRSTARLLKDLEKPDFTTVCCMNKSNKTDRPQDTVLRTSTSDTYQLYSINNATNGYLVISELFYPGWNAYVNGKRSDIIRSNMSMRAIHIPKGKNIIELRYQPKSYKAGLSITLFSMAIYFLMILTSVARIYNRNTNLPE